MGKTFALGTVAVVFLALCVVAAALALSRNMRILPSFSTGILSGTCIVLEQQFCKNGTLLLLDGKFFGFGYKLPINTPIFSPFDGRTFPAGVKLVRGDKPFVYKSLTVLNSAGRSGIIGTDKSITFVFYSGLAGNITVKKGDLLGRINNRELDYFGKYNLIVYLSNPSKQHSLFPDLESTKNFFGL